MKFLLLLLLPCFAFAKNENLETALRHCRGAGNSEAQNYCIAVLTGDKERCRFAGFSRSQCESEAGGVFKTPAQEQAEKRVRDSVRSAIRFPQ